MNSRLTVCSVTFISCGDRVALDLVWCSCMVSLGEESGGESTGRGEDCTRRVIKEKRYSPDRHRAQKESRDK